MRRLVSRILPVADLLLAPFVYPSAWLLKNVRRAGVSNLPACRRALLTVGVFPIRRHYYEPQFDFRENDHPLSLERSLPGIEWNTAEQLKLLETFKFSEELTDLPHARTDPPSFHLNNGAFESGDAEYWYQLVRTIKPRRVFEIGGGHSTLMAIKAIRRNCAADPDYRCKHVCIEPYEMPWLEGTGVSIVRKPVEELVPSFFSELQENDILFIDSSHIIRPQGDVLFEYLQLLPTLCKGVIVHVHDIFSPRNYPKEWVEDQVKFWNEQYLLEAFLSHNHSWKILGSLNFLHHNYYDRLKAVAPLLTPEREPGSFYMQKIL